MYIYNSENGNILKIKKPQLLRKKLIIVASLIYKCKKLFREVL